MITYSKNKADSTFQPKGSYCTLAYMGIIENPIDISLEENASYILIDGYNLETFFAVMSCGWGGKVAFQAIGNIDAQLSVTKSQYTLHLQPTGVHIVGVAKISFA